MKSLGKYVFMLLGIPNVAGFALVSGLAALIVRAIPEERRDALLAFADISAGFASVFIGGFMARMVTVGPPVWLPMLAVAWFAIHFMRRNKVAEFTRASVGVLSGWWAY